MLVHTRNQGEVGTSSVEESLAPTDADFFESFQAVGNKRRADHQQFLDSARGEIWQLQIRIRPQPWVPAKPRLERERIFFRRQTGLFHECGGGFETLGAVTGGVRRARRLAAIRRGKTMAACRIGLANLPLRNTVKAEQQMVEWFAEVWLGASDERVNVIGMLEVRW